MVQGAAQATSCDFSVLQQLTHMQRGKVLAVSLELGARMAPTGYGDPRTSSTLMTAAMPGGCWPQHWRQALWLHPTTRASLTCSGGTL